jgi:hypothetical protein
LPEDLAKLLSLPAKYDMVAWHDIGLALMMLLTTTRTAALLPHCVVDGDTVRCESFC